MKATVLVRIETLHIAPQLRLILINFLKVLNSSEDAHLKTMSTFGPISIF